MSNTKEHSSSQKPVSANLLATCFFLSLCSTVTAFIATGFTTQNQTSTTHTDKLLSAAEGGFSILLTYIFAVIDITTAIVIIIHTLRNHSTSKNFDLAISFISILISLASLISLFIFT